MGQSAGREMLTLQPIRDEDLPLLERIFASTREDIDQLDWTPEQKATFIQQQHTAQHSYYQEHYPEAAFDLILKEGVPIGRLYVDRQPHELHIIDIALLPEHRGQGIGGQIMQELLDEAAEHQQSVRIFVLQNNVALHLYQRLGFRIIGDTGVYYEMEWTPN